MEALVSVLVGAMVAAAIYLMLDRNLLRFLFGLTLISNAVNLLIFSNGRLTPGAPAVHSPPDPILEVTTCSPSICAARPAW